MLCLVMIQLNHSCKMHMTVLCMIQVFRGVSLYISQTVTHILPQIAKTLRSTSIRYQFDTKVLDQCLINVYPWVFAIWGTVCMVWMSMAAQHNCCRLHGNTMDNSFLKDHGIDCYSWFQAYCFPEWLWVSVSVINTRGIFPDYCRWWWPA